MEGWKVAAAENGSVVGLERNGCIYADEAHPLGAFLYEVFSPEDYQRFEDQYVTVRYDWALEEFGKIGMEKAVDRHLSAEPKVTGVWKKDSRLLIQMSMPKEAVERFGAPTRLELLMTFPPGALPLIWPGSKRVHPAWRRGSGSDSVLRRYLREFTKWENGSARRIWC